MSQEWLNTNKQEKEVVLPSQEERRAKLDTPEGQALRKANFNVAYNYELSEDPRRFFRSIFEVLNHGEYKGKETLIAFKNFLESLSEAEKNLPSGQVGLDVTFPMVLKEVNELLPEEKIPEKSSDSNLQERRVEYDKQGNKQENTENILEDGEFDYYLTRLNLNWEKLDLEQFPDGYKDGGRMWKVLLDYVHRESTTDQLIPVQSLPGNGFSATSFKFADQYNYHNLTCEGGAEKLENDIQEVPDGSVVVVDEGTMLIRMENSENEENIREARTAFNVIVKAIKEKHFKVLLHLRPNEYSARIAEMFQKEGIQVSAPFEFGHRPNDMEYVKEQLKTDELSDWVPNYKAVTFRELQNEDVALTVWQNLSKEAQELVIKIGDAERGGEVFSFDNLSAREKEVFNKFIRFGVFRRTLGNSVFVRDKVLCEYGKE